ncbi:hypothetical protein AGABI2DRAFT_193449 [Agaricus bisporus var. bisporus H97]|uniref:hypothetical protein n=1 Tax=Agaricus bisporus var. bisporus (strain H97 / ATCC MYA-4626 / FGSC 10389) TaxID=936046 RepID=UPI00029F8012|nr:hypothetical protein AGABI2DRAFT_193449 [Agaricus bisporus var. bisporus H97]EKV46855.1 hypothetical protein AGABI2DRAFT_193449 [Agaricus bisporus var. bisporus H97]
MPKVDWKAPRSLITNLNSNFPFIFAGEPALWSIRDITNPNRPVSRRFAPALMHLYNQFDAYLRNHDYSHPAPIGYSEFARVFNAHDDTPYGYTCWDESSNSWIIPDRKHISNDDLNLLDYAMAVHSTRNRALIDLGVADANGHIKDRMVIGMARVLDAMTRKERELSPFPRGRNGFRRGRNKPYDRVDKRREGSTNGNGTPVGPQSPIINSPSTSTAPTLMSGNVISNPTATNEIITKKLSLLPERD